ncbi:MAG: hypothetical protein KJO82_07060 [Gammaproteobacteria bacterium]|nr:hypothetical protein [Gammaproteobacteria bacterium]
MTPVGSATLPGAAIYTPVADSRQLPQAAEKPGPEHRQQHSTNRGLQVFRAEMVQRLVKEFASLDMVASGAVARAEPGGSQQVAGQVLGMAKFALDFEGGSRASLIMRMRQTMQLAAISTRELVPAADDIGDVDAATQSIDEGLAELESTGERQITASLTTVDTLRKQRTSLRIRTQEGDFVKIDLKRIDAMSATDVAIDDGENGLTYTEVQVSSKSKLMLRVEGDLNEAELTAIRDVFAQAEELAETYFAGDIEAALDVVAGFDFDAEQIAGVSLRFRAFEASSVSQALIQTRLPAIVGDQPATPAIDQPAAAADTPVAANSPVPAEPPPATLQPVPPPETDSDAGSPASGPASPVVTLLDFFAQLRDFLDGLAARLDPVPLPEPPDSSTKFEFTRPVKLDVLKAAFIELAPPAYADDPASTVDRLTEVASARLDNANSAST